MSNDQTLGEARVRVTFNPSNDTLVDSIKQKSAELINLVSSIPDGSLVENPAEAGRLKALASTAYEEAAMWAVKAATCKLV